MKREYEKPELNVITVQVERGFAGSVVYNEAEFNNFYYDGTDDNSGI